MSPSIQPFFIIGSPRSGTTLLQQMLNAHPSIAVAPETFFMQRFVVNADQYGDLTQDANFGRLIEEICTLPEFRESGVSEQHFREEALTISRTYQDLFSLFLSLFQQLHQARWVGEKTPDHLYYVRELLAFFPKAKFIHLIRDPRAVVLSHKSLQWSSGQVYQDAVSWGKRIRKLESYPPHLKSAILTVSFEDLLTHTQPVLTNITQFLGAEFDPAMMEYHQQEQSTVNFEREPWKHNVSKPTDSRSVDRWKTQLSSQEITEIEVAIGPIMSRYGYQPNTPQPSLSLLTIADKIKRIPRKFKRILRF